MGISRRHFLELSSIAAAAACAVPLEGVTQEQQRGAAMARGAVVDTPPGARLPVPASEGTLSESTFHSLVNQKFTVTMNNGKKATAILIAVENPTGASTAKFVRTQSFVLRFRLSSGATLKQGTYDFSNSNTGKFSLFIVPFGTNGTSTTFTATISNPPA